MLTKLLHGQLAHDWNIGRQLEAVSAVVKGEFGILVSQ